MLAKTIFVVLSFCLKLYSSYSAAELSDKLVKRSKKGYVVKFDCYFHIGTIYYVVKAQFW